MPHRIITAPFGVYWLAGATSWLASRMVVWSQQLPADPGSMTDVVGSGGIAVSAGAVAMSFMSLVRFLAQLYNENAEAARKERDRIRAAEQADKERAFAEARAVREHDERLRTVEAEALGAKRRADAAEAEAHAVAVELTSSRERHHRRDNEIERVLRNVMIQVSDNTEVANRTRPALLAALGQLGIDLPLPDPVEPYLATMEPPKLVIKPTPGELGRPPGGAP
jgi:hypothetical protein